MKSDATTDHADGGTKKHHRVQWLLYGLAFVSVAASVAAILWTFRLLADRGLTS